MNKNFKSFFEKKRNFKKYSFLVIIAAIFLIIPEGRANAQVLTNLWDAVNNPIDALLSPIYGLIFMILNIFLLISTLWVMFGAWLVDTAMSPALYVGSSFPGPVLPGVLNSDAVQIGWATVRDMCNMFFMFFMLAVAFGTILRSKSFNVKNILPKIIIAMFLINFSMVITNMIIDISQFFMYEIASWMTSFAGEAGSLTSIVHMFNDKIDFLNVKNILKVYRFNDVVEVAMALLYSIILGAVYVMLAIFLLIRLVSFAVLIILSPFAFLSMAIPSMSKHTAKWWGELSKWAIFGPVFMFFIFLSATMANEFVGQTDVYGPALPPELGFLGAAFYRVIMASIPIIMLLMAPQVAHELGAKGAAQLVGGRAGIGNIIQGTRGAGKKGWGTAKWGGAWGGRRIGKDSRDAGDYLRGKTIKLANKLPGGIGKRVGQRITGHLTLQQTGKKAEDRKGIEESRSDIKDSSGKSSIVMAEGFLAKRLRSGESLSKKDESKFIAAVEHAISKGEDVSKFEGQFAMMASRGANIDEIAKFDPVSAGKMKRAIDTSKTAEEHTTDYLQEHAESGDWKKYSKHIRQNNFKEMSEHIDSKDLQSHIKNSGPKARKDYEFGADKMMQILVDKINKAAASTDPVERAKVPGLNADLETAREKIRKATGNFEISDAERRRDGFRIEEISGNQIGHGEKASAADNVKLHSTGILDAIKVTGGADFKKLTNESKVAYAKHAENTGDISGLQLKEEDSAVLREMAAAIRVSGHGTPNTEMGDHEILKNY